MKNLRNLSIFACLFLLVFIPMRAEALPPPSPAGGNYLVLDGVDDHAILDFETFGLLIPEGTNAFTFEAWIYPTTLADEDENVNAIIFSQQVRMDVVSHDLDRFVKLTGGAHVDFGEVNTAMTFGWIIELTPNQWHHIAFQGGKKQKTTIILNELGRVSAQRITLAPDISHAGHPQDFTIGGFGKKIKRFFHGDHFHFWGHFSGYIDEVRISKIARYDIAKRGFTPRTKFKNDARTVALWHFDELRGTREFSDTSGNAYHLVGKNGAMTDGTLAVEAEGKLAITWGQLKQ